MNQLKQKCRGSRVSILVPASQRTKNPSSREINRSLSQRCFGGKKGGTKQAPNKYHMPKQLAPPNLIAQTLKKSPGWSGDSGCMPMTELCLKE